MILPVKKLRPPLYQFLPVTLSQFSAMIRTASRRLAWRRSTPELERFWLKIFASSSPDLRHAFRNCLPIAVVISPGEVWSTFLNSMLQEARSCGRVLVRGVPRTNRLSSLERRIGGPSRGVVEFLFLSSAFLQKPWRIRFSARVSPAQFDAGVRPGAHQYLPPWQRPSPAPGASVVPPFWQIF